MRTKGRQTIIVGQDYVQVVSMNIFSFTKFSHAIVSLIQFLERTHVFLAKVDMSSATTDDNWFKGKITFA
jgi:hypothetical protein